MRKILIGLIVVFVLVIIFEGLYLFNVFNIKKMSGPENNRYEPFLEMIKTDLRLKEEGILQQAETDYTFEFEILDVGGKDKIPQKDQSKNNVAVIKYMTNSGPDGMIFNEREYNLLEVEDYNGSGKNDPITFSDLKPGDTVKLQMVVDIYNELDNSVKSIIITRLN